MYEGSVMDKIPYVIKTVHDMETFLWLSREFSLNFESSCDFPTQHACKGSDDDLHTSEL
jgi:hypothetical protein